jgi:peptide/nickel transport system substrate-binding protein
LATAAALGALAIPAVPAVAEDAPTPSATPGKVSFVLGIKQDIDSLNPYVGVVASAYEAYQLMYDYLTGSSDKDFSATPGLAERWDTSADGKTWTYHIRKGVKWSDGRDLTAKDVVYSFQRAIDGETENGQYGNYVSNVTKVTATDDYTVVMETSAPSPSMLRLLVPILPEHTWKDVDGKEVATFANDNKPVGSGPFRLVEVQTNQFYRFEANKSYWGGAPKIDELVIRIFADDEALGQALRSGAVDMVQDISAAVFDTLRNVPGITTSDSKYYGFNELAYNLGAATVDNKPIGDGHPALKDKRVRIAIEKVLRNHGTAATGVIAPIYANWHWTAGDGERVFDLAKANQLLDDAGYRKGSDGVRAGPDGKRLQFRLFGREESETSKDDVNYIADWLNQIGIKTTVSIMSEDQLTAVIGEGKYDMFEWGWVVEPDPDFQLSVFTCGQRSTEDGGEISAGWSDSFYCNPAYDALYEQQNTILDPAARTAVIKQAQQMLYDEAVYSMLFYYNNFEAYRSDRFTGFKPQPTDGGSLVFQYGTYSYLNIQRVSQDTGGDTRSNTLWLVLGIVAGVVVLGGVATGVLLLRRKSTADERE